MTEPSAAYITDGLPGKIRVPVLREQGPAALLYVSCNPESLARDLAALKDFYSVDRAEIVDLFPHTEHVETVVWLKRS